MYITDSNLKWLLSNIEVGYPDYDLLKKVDPHIVSLLSFVELKNLTAAALLFKGEVQDIKLIEKLKPRDSRNAIFKSGPPAYHFHDHCEWLTKDYFNFEVPQRVQALGEGEIEEYKKFFRGATKDRFVSDAVLRQGIIAAIQAYYLNKGLSLTEGEIFTKVEHQNSGFIDLDSLEKQVLLANSSLVEFLNELKNSSNPRLRQVYEARYMKSNLIKYCMYLPDHEEDEQSVAACKLADLKGSYTNRVTQWLKVKQNFNANSLDQIFLNNHGFKLCDACAKNHPEKIQWDFSKW